MTNTYLEFKNKNNILKVLLEGFMNNPENFELKSDIRENILESTKKIDKYLYACNLLEGKEFDDNEYNLVLEDDYSLLSIYYSKYLEAYEFNYLQDEILEDYLEETEIYDSIYVDKFNTAFNNILESCEVELEEISLRTFKPEEILEAFGFLGTGIKVVFSVIIALISKVLSMVFNIIFGLGASSSRSRVDSINSNLLDSATSFEKLSIEDIKKAFDVYKKYIESMLNENTAFFKTCISVNIVTSVVEMLLYLVSTDSKKMSDTEIKSGLGNHVGELLLSVGATVNQSIGKNREGIIKAIEQIKEEGLYAVERQHSITDNEIKKQTLPTNGEHALETVTTLYNDISNKTGIFKSVSYDISGGSREEELRDLLSKAKTTKNTFDGISSSIKNRLLNDKKKSRIYKKLASILIENEKELKFLYKDFTKYSHKVSSIKNLIEIQRNKISNATFKY